MEIRYQCNAGDYLEGQRAHAKKTFGYYFMLVLGVLCLLGAALLAVGRTNSSPIPLLILGLWWLVCPLVYWPWKVKKDFRKNPNLSREYSMTVDAEGIQSKSEVSQGARKWAVYVRYRETSNLLLLYQGSRLFGMIPKRAFTEPELEEFRKLLQLNVGAK